MADIRVTLEAAAAIRDYDQAKIDATTEDDIRHYMIEDGEDPDAPLTHSVRVVHPPAEIRRRVGLTQAEMAKRLRVPLRTWRNWEQGRVALEPTVRSFLALVADDPERAFRVLGDE